MDGLEFNFIFFLLLNRLGFHLFQKHLLSLWRLCSKGKGFIYLFINKLMFRWRCQTVELSQAVLMQAQDVQMKSFGGSGQVLPLGLGPPAYQTHIKPKPIDSSSHLFLGKPFLFLFLQHNTTQHNTTTCTLFHLIIHNSSFQKAFHVL